VTGGHGHTLALTEDGHVWAWGSNAYGQLGDGSGVDRTTPVELPAFPGGPVIAVSAGANHSLALTGDGRVWAWGYNALGRLGDGTTTSRLAPVQVPFATNVVRMVAGYDHSLAVTTDGSLWAWGLNTWGQRGDGGTLTHTLATRVPLAPGTLAVAAGKGSSLAAVLDRAGEVTLLAWGLNGSGELGDGTAISQPSPTRVSGLANPFALSAGEQHSLAVAVDGSVWSWGASTYGQLGNGGLTGRWAPGPIPGFTLADNSWLVGDPDGDGLITGIEHLLGGNPLERDTNGDGIDDGTAARSNLSLSDLDVDHDGLSNAQEIAGGADPFDPDSDGDGTLDGSDCFPLDTSRSACAEVPGDTTPPAITLSEPAEAQLIP
jgi:hypothetical protein